MSGRTFARAKGYKAPVLDRRPPSNKFMVVIRARQASAEPPLGPKLGKNGINIATFCKDFNLKTQNYVEGIPLPCKITVNPDRTCSLIFNKPSFTYYLKQAAGITNFQLYKGISGKVLVKHIYEIAKIQHSDEHSPMQLRNLRDICKEYIERAYENGIQVVKDYDAEEYTNYLVEKAEYIKKLEAEIAAAEEAKLLRG